MGKRGLALVAAFVHLILSGFAWFALSFGATFPFEMETPEEAAADDWVLKPAAAIGILGLVIFVVVLAQWSALTVITVGAQLLVGSVLFVLLVREYRSFDDGLAMPFAIVFALTAVGAATNAVERG